MPVHNFRIKPERLYRRRQPLIVYWVSEMGVKYLRIKKALVTQDVFAQEILSIESKRNGDLI